MTYLKIKQKGFTLLEIVITLGIMALTVSAIAQLYQTYLRLTADEKFKITATSLANQKIEIIRNLSYSNIGTLGGIPAGTIPQSELVNRNGYDFTVSTEIIYIDDPFDGTFEPGEVSNPYDINNPEVIYYWNLNSVNNNQIPQKGSGTITTSAALTATSGVVSQAILYTPSTATDYARFELGSNLDTTKGRIGFWYQPNSKNESSDRRLFYVTGCTGQFNLVRKNSNKLEFLYGQSPESQYISTHPLEWNVGQWYFIEFLWDSDTNEIAVFRDNEEVGYESTGNIIPPINCTYIYVGNSSTVSTNNANGAIDELYILDNPYPSNVPQDFLNTDYKRIKVTVSWITPNGPKEIYVITDIAPPGIETTEGGGTMILHVFDSEGNPVPQADIHITNSVIYPAIDLSLTSDDEGNLILPGVPASIDYMVAISKTGYSLDQTYTPTSTYPTPIRGPIAIVEAKSTEIGFAIDRISSLTIKTVSRTLPGNWLVVTGPTSTNYTSGDIIAGSSTIFTIWEDYRDDLITSRTYGQNYNFTGVNQWLNDLQLSSAQNQLSPAVTIDGDNIIYSVWSSNYGGNYEIYGNKHSDDGTDVWGGQKKISQDLTGSEKSNPDITYASGQLYVVWEDKRNDQGDIYLMYFDTDGNKISTFDKQINTDSTSAVQTYPRIVKNTQNEIIIGWLDNRNGVNEIYLTKLDSNGNFLWASETKVNTETPSVNHDNLSLTTDSTDNIYIAWSDNRTTQQSLYIQKFDTNGNKLFSNDILIATQAPSAQQQDPQIIADTNDELFIVWQDDRSGHQDIFAHKIDSTGNPIWTQETQLNLSPTDGDQTLDSITIYQNTNLAVAWTDSQTGQTTIWNATLNYQNDETPVPYVDFTLHGSKLIYQSPDLLKYTHNLSTNAQGVLSLSNMEWDTYNVLITDPSYSLLITEPTLPLFLPAATTTEIKIIVQ